MLKSASSNVNLVRWQSPMKEEHVLSVDDGFLAKYLSGIMCKCPGCNSCIIIEPS